MQAINRPVFRDVMQDVFPFSVERIFSNGEPGVWYDVSDLSTLFQDRAGTIRVTAIGQPVGRILDKSGRGNHLTAISDVSRGLYQADVSGRPFVLFDGVNDGYITPTITPGIDKVQVFAGVRKIGTARAMLVEHSVSFGNAGTFGIEAPYDGGANDYRFVSGGSLAAAGIAQGSGFVPPITNVVTGLADISGDRATLRVNGTQAAQSIADQGTGNYLAYPLYIGRRGGTTLPFNGNLYSLIVRFGPNLNAQRIRQVERYVAEKNGVIL